MKKRWLVYSPPAVTERGPLLRAARAVGETARPNPCLSSLPSLCGERGTTAPPVLPARRAMAMRWKSPTPMQPKSLAGWMSMRKGSFKRPESAAWKWRPATLRGKAVRPEPRRQSLLPPLHGRRWRFDPGRSDGGPAEPLTMAQSYGTACQIRRESL